MNRRGRRSEPVNKHAQHAVLTRPANFHFNHFQPARACHPLGNLPDLIQIKSHVFSTLRPESSRQHSRKPAQTKKWAFAHWCASTILALRHNSIHLQLYAANLENTNQGGIPQRPRGNDPPPSPVTKVSGVTLPSRRPSPKLLLNAVLPHPSRHRTGLRGPARGRFSRLSELAQ